MADGVPPLLDADAAPYTGPAVTQDTVQPGNTAPRWGIYKDGAAVAVADSVVRVDYMQDTRVSQYPLEKGAFAAYNKVGTPYDARVRLVRGGTEAERKAFLDAIEAATASLDLYDVVTPEKTYTSATIQRHQYTRSAQAGVSLIAVDIVLTEIRTTAETTFSNTKSVDGANPVNVGTVQPKAPGTTAAGKVGS